MRILILINSSWNVVNFRSNLVKKIIQDEQTRLKTKKTLITSQKPNLKILKNL